MSRTLVLLCVALLAWPLGAADAAHAALFSDDAVEEEALERTPPPGVHKPSTRRAPASPLNLERRYERHHDPIARRRGASMNSRQLADLRRDVQRLGHGVARLNLFRDATHEAVFEYTAPTADGYTLTGHLVDDAWSTVVLAVNGDVMSGIVWSAEAIYTIDALGEAAVIRQANPDAMMQCQTGERPKPEIARRPRPAVPQTPAPAEVANIDDGSVIDVLVVYQSLVRRSRGGHRAMRTLIDRDVALANEAYRAGGAEQRINLVAAVEVEYGEAEKDHNMSDMLDHLSNLYEPSTGYMDEVPALRESYAADLVLLHRGDLTGGVSGVFSAVRGIAFQVAVLDSEAEAPYGYSISDSFAFAHELGHGMGLRHDRGEDAANTPFPYSHGHVAQSNSDDVSGLHTIMAYGVAEKKVHRFSNPGQTYPGTEAVMGVPGDDPSDSEDGPADAVRSLNGTRRFIANFKASADRCTYSLTSSPATLPASGGEYRVQVSTTPQCEWTARSNDDFVTVAEGAGGSGAGDVQYSVLPNPGWEREVAILIAGEVHLVRQLGQRTVEPRAACDRTLPVLLALEQALGKKCATITASDMASIQELSVGGGPLGESVHRPFMGMTNLRRIELRSTDLTTLPANMFDGLPNLFELELSYNHALQTIQSGAFNGLTNLYNLEITGRHGVAAGLTSLQSGAFGGLYNLQRLDVIDQRLVALHEGTFDGLTKLHGLRLFSIPIRAAAPGTFRGLANLDYLVFSDASITTLSPNVFGGLSNLTSLDLRHHSRLTALPPGTFAGLTKLTELTILEAPLTTLPEGLLNELSSLSVLWIGDTNIATVEPRAFGGLDKLEWLTFGNNALTTVEAFQGLSNLETLDLNYNSIEDISGLSTLLNLEQLYLALNQISDVGPLVANGGIGPGDYIRLDGNPWSEESRRAHIPALRRRGTTVYANQVVHIGNARAEEGDPLVFPVALSHPRDTDLRVDWEEIVYRLWPVPPHYHPDDRRGTLVIPAGATSASFSIRTLEDDFDQRDEEIVAVLRPPPDGLPDGLVIEGVVGIGTIIEDDAPTDNQAPHVVSPLPDIYAKVGQRTTLVVASNFADADGDSLVITAASSDPSVATVTLVGEETLVVDARSAGLVGVVVTAADPAGKSAALTFAVRVSQSRHAVVGADDSLSAPGGEFVHVDLPASFRELDDYALFFVATSSDPTVATVEIEGHSATIHAGLEGSTTIVVTATDPLGETKTSTFTVNVSKPNLGPSGLPIWLLETLATDED